MRGGGSGVGMMRQAVANRLGDGDEEELGKPYDHKVILRLLTYLQPYRTKAVFALLAMIAYTTTAASVPFFVRAGINRITEKDSSGLDTVVFIFAGVALAGWLAQYIQMMLMAQINTGILYTLRVQMFRHLQRLSLSFYDKNEVGRIMSRVQNDILNLQEFLTGGVQSIAELFVLVFVVGSMFYMEPTLAAFTLTVVPVLLIALAIWQKYARSAFIRVRQAIALVNADLQENISGVRVIQSLSREEENAKRFDSVNSGNLNKNLKAGRLSAMIMPMVEILMATAITIVVIYGGNRVLDGSIEVAIVIAFALFVLRFFDPIRTLTMQYTEMQKAMASGARVFEVLDTEPQIVDAPHALELTRIKGDITFDHVSHHYVSGVEVLHDINLHIEPGETVALVGETGAGKTTITALIARFYECSEGTVSVDGNDVTKVTMGSLAKQISLVLQDPFLFSATVKNNILYGRLDATDEEVEQAARTVGAHDFIMRLQHGYDSMLAERGGNLSVGQRQLVSFARAVLADPVILILDEATANIDTHTEVLIQKALKKLLTGRTSVVIAHRLSTIRNADRIVVMEYGRIKETGTHAELMTMGGIYSRLYTMNYQLETEVSG